MNYNKLTKAQLIQHIKVLETQTVEYKCKTFVNESKLLLQDLAKAADFVYLLGIKTRRFVDGFNLSIFKPEEQTPDGCSHVEGSLYEFNY